MTRMKTWLRSFDRWTLAAFNPEGPGYRGR